MRIEMNENESKSFLLINCCINKQLRRLGFEVLTAVSMKIAVFCLQKTAIFNYDVWSSGTECIFLFVIYWF
jgi:hypothetical protein